jgi:hypothetical protein
MPLWTRTIRPNWPPEVPEDVIRASAPQDMNNGAEHQGWIRIDTKETVVCLHVSRDDQVCNLEYEDNFNIILEDAPSGEESFLLLEVCPTNG